AAGPWAVPGSARRTGRQSAGRSGSGANGCRANGRAAPASRQGPAEARGEMNMASFSSDHQDAVVHVDRLSRRFGAKLALEDLSLAVPRGTVFGIVGANGAGKTTLIRHVLGLLRAQSGSVRVFGRDPVADPVGVLKTRTLPLCARNRPS